MPDGALLLVGISERTSFGAASKTIPALWQKFVPHYESIADKAQPIPLGVYTGFDEDGHFDFWCAVEVSRLIDVPGPLAKLAVPKQTYAVFPHRGHVSTIGETYDAIWNDWLPFSGRTAADGPSLEHADPGFDPRTGNGGHTVWVPVTG